MKKGNHVLNKKDVENIEKLLAEGVDENVIIDIMKMSKSTLNRIKRKEHYLQRETANPTPKPKSKTVEEKLDRIIEQLDELLNLWR